MEKEEEMRNLQQQIQILNMQKQQIRVQANELDRALDELKTAKGSVYKSAGNLLIEVSKKEAEDDIKKKKEGKNLRLKTIEKQEKRFASKLEDLKKGEKEK